MKTILPLLMLFLAGCASTDKVVFDATARPPTVSVDVFALEQSPHGRVIAELTFLGPPQDELRAQRFFIKQAQQLGGDAVAVWKTGGTLGAVRLGPTFNMEFKFLYHAKVITYDTKQPISRKPDA